MTQEAISTYGDIVIMKEALEKAGKADRVAVADAIRSMNLTSGPAAFFPGGLVAFDDMGRRKDSKFLFVQWQGGKAITVYPPEAALAAPYWPKQ